MDDINKSHLMGHFTGKGGKISDDISSHPRSTKITKDINQNTVHHFDFPTIHFSIPYSKFQSDKRQCFGSFVWKCNTNEVIF